MYKILLITGLFLLSCSPAQAQEPVAVDTVAVETQVPDSLCVTVKGDRICLPTKDAVEVERIISEFVKEQNGQWPKNALGWVLLIFGFITSDLPPFGVTPRGFIPS
jgi:hypothetical protein